MSASNRVENNEPNATHIVVKLLRRDPHTIPSSLPRLNDLLVIGSHHERIGVRVCQVVGCSCSLVDVAKHQKRAYESQLSSRTTRNRRENAVDSLDSPMRGINKVLKIEPIQEVVSNESVLKDVDGRVSEERVSERFDESSSSSWG